VRECKAFSLRKKGREIHIVGLRKDGRSLRKRGEMAILKVR